MPILGNNDILLKIASTFDDKGTKEAESKLGNLEGVAKGVGSAATKLTGGLLALGAATAGLSIVGANYTGDLESMTIALTTFTKDTKKAEQAMAVIKKTAQDSPFFDTRTLAEFTQRMAGAGQEINKAVSSALRFGDVAAAFGRGNEELNRMGNTIAQVIGKGRADIIDFRELVNSGWTSVQRDVAEAMGVSMSAFQDMVSEGKVGYDDILRAAEKYNGAAERQSNTWNALKQRMTEAFQSQLSQILTTSGAFDALKEGMKQVIPLIEQFGGWISGTAVPALKDFFSQRENVIGFLTALSVLLGIIAIQVVLATWPVIALTAALVALGLVVAQLVKLWDSDWAGIRTTVLNAFNAINAYIEGFKNNWAQAIGQIIGFKLTLPIRLPIIMMQALAAMASMIIPTLFNAWVDGWNRMINFVRNINWSSVFAVLGSALIGAMQGALKNLPFGNEIGKALKIPGFAEGVRNFSGGLAVVGERGPELVSLPRGPTSIQIATRAAWQESTSPRPITSITTSTHQWQQRSLALS